MYEPSERDKEVNRQIAAIVDQRERMQREADDIWLRVKTVWNDRLAIDQKKPTRKQQARLDELSREIKQCRTAESALFNVR